MSLALSVNDSCLIVFSSACWASLLRHGRLYSSSPWLQHLVVRIQWQRVSYRKETRLVLIPNALLNARNCPNMRYYQSTAQPLSAKNSSQACFNAMLGRRSSKCNGSLVSGSVCDRFRCSSTVDRSYVLPVFVTTGSCMTVKDMLSMR